MAHALADLVLDTPFYNGGATGLDVLWAGVPALTLPAAVTAPGATPLGRMGASLHRSAFDRRRASKAGSGRDEGSGASPSPTEALLYTVDTLKTYETELARLLQPLPASATWRESRAFSVSFTVDAAPRGPPSDSRSPRRTCSTVRRAKNAAALFVHSRPGLGVCDRAAGCTSGRQRWRTGALSRRAAAAAARAGVGAAPVHRHQGW